MEISVSGHQIDTGSALQEYATDRLESLREKYFARALSAHVTLSPDGSGTLSSDIVMHVNRGLILKAHGQAGDAHQAFDAAHTKLEKQLRRYKSRVQDHHKQAQEAREIEEAAYTVFAAVNQDEAEIETSDAPAIVAETTADIPEASVADAVMMLDLRDTGALFFKNARSGRHNMVYRRRDGTVGWVEPR